MKQILQIKNVKNGFLSSKNHLKTKIKDKFKTEITTFFIL